MSVFLLLKNYNAYYYLLEMIKLNEGLVLKNGVSTIFGNRLIGYGHRLTMNEFTSDKIIINNKVINWKNGLTLNECENLLLQDLNSSIKLAQYYCGHDRWNWLMNNHINWACIIVEKIYNVGMSVFLQFFNMIYHMGLYTPKDNNEKILPETLSNIKFNIPVNDIILESRLYLIAISTQVVWNNKLLISRNISNIQVFVYVKDIDKEIFYKINSAYKSNKYWTFYSLIHKKLGFHLM